MSENRLHVQHYYSVNSGATPSPENLYLGEIAINVADEKIMFKNNNNEIVEISTNDSLKITTYNELKELRDNSELKSGTFYRITDYETMTSAPGTKSAGHPFDVIVLALSDNTLSEEAYAIKSERDTENYFGTSNLSAWKIWYSLDNDVNRFEWMGNALPVNNPTLNGINPEYFIFVDGNGDEMQSYENVIDETNNDIFYWYDYTNDNEGNNTLVLYKTNINGIQQDSDYLNADSSNVFFYQGTEEYDGVVYDKWRKIEPETYTWDNEEKIFVLTQQIVENNSIKEEYLYNAESVDGKGVIYRMIDEYGNDCPYDFKNIQFNYSSEKKVDSSNCSINASLVDGNSFNEPFTPVAYMFIDTNGKIFENYEGFEGKSTDDLFYEYGYETTPDGLENQLCLFKSDVEVYEDEGTDYGDKFFYWGTYDYDGEIYDIWKKSEVGGDGDMWFENGDGLGNIFILTNRIVEGETIVPSDKNYYTFTWVDSDGNVNDASIVGNDGTLRNDSDEISGVFSNVIGKYIEDGVNKLPVNIFIGDYNHEYGIYYGCQNNTFGVNCQNNTFGNNCYNNTFGNYCDNNTFGDDCFNNTFDDTCYRNTFGDVCYYNTFGNNCNDNTFGDSCHNNTFGDGCYRNTFGDGCHYNTFSNKCVFNTFGDGCENNTFGDACDNNTFGHHCYNNIFGYGCTYNTFDDSCSYNIFGNYCGKVNGRNTLNSGCTYNQMGDNCYNNTFGDNCYNNTFGNYCYNNTFGKGCKNNTFGNNYYYNTFGYDCNYNTFGNHCYYNTFGNNCRNNTFGNNCYNNTFGYDCYYNTFGNYCYYNTFGNYCYNNTFGNNCYHNTFVDGSGNTRSYCSNNVFENSCSYNKIIAPNVGSSAEVLQNLHIHSGFKGERENLKETVINTINSVIDIDIYQDESGETCINKTDCGTF